jgi:hypothetical protein
VKQNYDIAFFEALLSGKISAMDQERFQEALESDPELQYNFDSIQHILNGLNGLRNKSFQSEVEKWEEELKTEVDMESEMLDAYMDQQLSTQESEFVAAKIENDDQLKTHFDAMQGIMQGFKGIRESEMTGKVKGWEQEIQEGEKNSQSTGARRITFGKSWAVAATVLILIIAGQFILNHTFGNQQLLKEAYAPPLTTTVRGGEGSQTDLEAALALLKTNRLEESLQKVESVLSLDAQNDRALLLKAHILFTQKQNQEASSALSLISTKSISISQEKNWLGVLLDLRLTGATPELHDSLQEIAGETNHPYQKPAIQLQKSLQSTWRKLLLFK